MWHEISRQFAVQNNRWLLFAAGVILTIAGCRGGGGAGAAVGKAGARQFGPQIAEWIDANNLWGVVWLIVFVFLAWQVLSGSHKHDQGVPPEQWRHDRRYGKLGGFTLAGIGLALFARSMAFGEGEAKVVQEVVWSVVAGVLGVVAVLLLVLWAFGVGQSRPKM